MQPSTLSKADDRVCSDAVLARADLPRMASVETVCPDVARRQHVYDFIIKLIKLNSRSYCKLQLYEL